jgi:hypothetical protein
VFGIVLPDWAVVSAAIAGLLVILKAFSDALGLIEKSLVLLSKILGSFRRRADGIPRVPSRTVAVIPEPRINAFWWSMGRAGDTPIMQVVADFYVTNTTERPIQLAGALLKVNRWLVLSRTERGNTMVKDLSSVYSGNYPVIPHRMTKVRADFQFVRPFVKAKRAFNSRIALIDQYGNEHWVFVRFKHIEAMFE